MSADVSDVYPVVASTVSSKMKTKAVPKAVDDAQSSFLQLLVAQISNQTPDSTLDATQMITQFAQMNAALGLQKLSSNVNFQKLSTATTLLHQKVTVESTDPDTRQVSQISGEVTGVDYTDLSGEPRIIVNGSPYNLDTVRRVGG
ncbi:MAG TPA: flagellar hook capping FlgD N-terminal domain-containing protein [Chroococcales cyanobacterium]|jgi:flagellar hook assembly protein FlgD